jgi:hypothetical protein
MKYFVGMGLTILSALLFLTVTQNALMQEQLATRPRAQINCNPLSISNLSVITERNGTFVTLLGNINNNSTFNFMGVTLVGELYDKSNKLIGVESSPAMIPNIISGKYSPFNVRIDVLNGTLNNYIITCVVTQAQ